MVNSNYITELRPYDILIKSLEKLVEVENKVELKNAVEVENEVEVAHEV